MFEVDCIEDEQGFFALKHEWDELWAHSFSPSVFLSHSWFQYCWSELKAVNQMRILVAREDDRAIAIAPLMKRRFSFKGFPVQQVTFVGHPETQMADFLLRNSETSTDALRVMLRYLIGQRSWDWQWILLDKIPANSKSLHCLANVSAFSSIPYELVPAHAVPVISLNRSWETYLRARTARFRKTLRNVVNRIGRLGRVEVKRYDSWPQLDEGLSKLFLVSDASWKVEEGIAITNNPQRRLFFHNLAQESSEIGGLQIWIFEVNGVPIASETQIRDGSTIYALRSDFDQRYADSSPGTFLQMEILKQLFDGSWQTYSFGVGNNPYKLHWADQEESLVRFQLYNQTLYGRFLRSLRNFSLASLKSRLGAQGKCF